MRYLIRNYHVELENTISHGLMRSRQSTPVRLTIELEELDEHPFFHSQEVRDMVINLKDQKEWELWNGWLTKAVARVVTEADFEAFQMERSL